MSEVLVATGGHLQRIPGENPPDTAATRRVVRIEHFEAPFALGDEEGAAYRRRFATLFADDARSRRGGLGRVTHVTNALGEQYALKTLIVPNEESNGEKSVGSDRRRREEVLRAAFRREYESQRALANLRGFPRIYGFGEVGGLPAIIMEWVEGITLADARRALAVDDAGRLSPLTVARIGAELFELVSRLSLVGEGLVHRDLSPANIMIRTSRHTLAEQRASRSFELCLIDFGSSAEAGTEGGSFTRSHAAVRHATADYAPPEMLSNDIAAVAELRRSSAIDVYAAASVLCELLDGRPPFAGVEDDADADVASPYRLKTEHAPARPCSAHRATGSLRDTISLEGETALVVGPLALERELSPDSDELRRALALVDDQLADILLSCLSVDQRRRPPAAAVRDELILFCEHYGENVRRALAGENLTPCMTGTPWLATEPMFCAPRVVRLLGHVIPALVWGVVGVATAWLVGSGHIATTAIALLCLMAPGIVALVARGRSSDARALRRGSIALLVATVAAACAMLLFPGQEARWPGLLAALFATGSASWCSLVIDYACAYVPALVRETRRQLPAAESGLVARIP